MFKSILGHMSTLKKLILLKKLTSSGGGGEPVVRIRYSNHNMTITGVANITNISYANHVLTMS